jgi:hypothetical protein
LTHDDGSPFFSPLSAEFYVSSYVTVNIRL